MRAPEKFATDEFLLRCYYPGDGPRKARAVNASLDHLKDWMPWAQAMQTDEYAEELVRKFRANYLIGTDFTIGIMSADDTEQLGGCGFHLRHRPLEAKEADIGMWVRADLANQGLGTRALIAMLTWGFSAWPWMRLTWTCAADNIPSRRTAERAGMRKEAEFRNRWQAGFETRRDEVVYASLRELWQAPTRSSK